MDGMFNANQHSDEQQQSELKKKKSLATLWTRVNTVVTALSKRGAVTVRQISLLNVDNNTIFSLHNLTLVTRQ